jgi:hypothetical protein
VLTCVYSREVWFGILQGCGWQQLTPSPLDSFVQWWLRSRKRVIKTRRHGFNSLVFLLTWGVWLERNAKVFRNASAIPSVLVASLWSSCEQWARAGLIEWSQIRLRE